MKRSESSGYIYDQNMGAVLNTNDDEYEAFKAKRDRFKLERDMKQRIEALEAQVLELKSMIERINETITKC